MENIVKQVVLIILDGWGYASSWGGNAIFEANTPVFDRLWREYPHTLLHASGEWVGLSGDERGNSEVGHMNLGAGKIVLQDSSFINKQLTTESLTQNKTLEKLITHVKNNNSNIHLVGLVSDGGIHSHINHLFLLLEYFSKYPELRNRIFVQGFTDGRDTPTRYALQLYSQLEEKMTQLQIGKIASICGRYYAMDRDNHWDRIQMCYDAMTSGVGRKTNNALSAISLAYTNGETDEFISPTIVVDDKQQPIAPINDNDAVIYFNFRSDRARELTLAIAANPFNKFRRKKICKNLFFSNLVPYGIEDKNELSNINTLFHPPVVKGSLAEILSSHNKNQLHIAETEKYAHVTYFFNGGVERPYFGEDRILVESPKVATYDMKPEMSANNITDNFIKQINKKEYDFVVVNFANTDMVGHTGNYRATLTACETVDKQLGKILEKIDLLVTTVIVTADHGNAEQMLNPRTGEMDTEHTNNMVPCIIISNEKISINQLNKNMKLANVAPTVLKVLNIAASSSMEEALF